MAMEFWWKKSFLQKHPIIRIIVNLVLFLVSVALFYYLYIKFRTNLIVAIAITVLLIGIPLLQRYGRALLEKERVVAIYQLKNDQKTSINRKRIVLAYIEMFMFYWILLFLAFLPPWPSAWAVLFFPTVVIYGLQILLWSYTWEDFDYKMRYYYLIHLAISVFCIVLSLTIKTIFIPYQ